jgi:hypothetical protein
MPFALGRCRTAMEIAEKTAQIRSFRHALAPLAAGGHLSAWPEINAELHYIYYMEGLQLSWEINV